MQLTYLGILIMLYCVLLKNDKNKRLSLKASQLCFYMFLI